MIFLRASIIDLVDVAVPLAAFVVVLLVALVARRAPTLPRFLAVVGSLGGVVSYAIATLGWEQARTHHFSSVLDWLFQHQHVNDAVGIAGNVGIALVGLALVLSWLMTSRRTAPTVPAPEA